MGLLSVGNIGPIDNGKSNIGQTGKIDLEKINTVFQDRIAHHSEPSDNSNADKYADFNSAVKHSPIKNKFMSEADLKNLGYTPTPGIKLVKDENGKLTSVQDPNSQLMDMNGGLHYENKKTGETIRVCEFEHAVEYRKDGMKHTQWYDDNGNPKGGMVVIQNKDGSSVEYHYENDINGNKFLTSVKQNEAENKAPKDFNGALEQSTLGAKFQTPEDLEAQGWVKEPYMDKNGGIYYKNPETGATIRVMEARLFGEGKTLTFKTDNMSHFVEYDDNGNETGGTVQVKLDDNTIKVYDYSVDMNGNKFIKSEEIVHQDYLSDYE